MNGRVPTPRLFRELTDPWILESCKISNAVPNGGIKSKRTPWGWWKRRRHHRNHVSFFGSANKETPKWLFNFGYIVCSKKSRMANNFSYLFFVWHHWISHFLWMFLLGHHYIFQPGFASMHSIQTLKSNQPMTSILQSSTKLRDKVSQWASEKMFPYQINWTHEKGF